MKIARLLLSISVILCSCGGSPSNSIDAVGQITFVSPSGRTQQPIDFSQSAVAALVEDGAGGFTTYPGTGGSGTIHIEGLPAGGYWLRYGGGGFLYTASRKPDLGYLSAGGPASTRPTISQSTTLQLSVTGLVPWSDGSSLELYAPQAGDWDFGTERFASSAPLAGATSTGLGIDFLYLDSGPIWTIDSSKGDALFLAQLKPQTSPGGVPYLALVGLGQAPALSVPGTASASITLSPPPVTAAPLSLDYRGTQWTALLAADANPALSGCNQPTGSFSVLAEPGTVQDGLYWSSADLLLYSSPTSSNPDVQTGAMALPDTAALGGTWTTWVDVGVGGGLLATLPGTKSAGCNLLSELHWTTTVQKAQAAPLVPPLGLPRAPLLAGQSAFAGGTGVGLTPTLTWTAPSKGTADFYEVRVSSLTAKNGYTSTRLVANLYTPLTSVHLPPGILAAGGSYAFTIQAIGSTSGTPLDPSAPRKQGGEVATAATATGIFTP